MKRSMKLFLLSLVLTGSAAAQPSWYHDEWKSGDTLYASSTAEDFSGAWVSASASITGPTSSQPPGSCDWYWASVVVSVPLIKAAIWTIVVAAAGTAVNWWATNSAELKKPITNFSRQTITSLCGYLEACYQAGGTPICGIGGFVVNPACTSHVQVEYKAFRFGTGAWLCYDPTETPRYGPVACTGG